MKNTAKCAFFLFLFCLFVLISLGENCSCGAIPACSVLGEDRGAKRLTDIPTDIFSSIFPHCENFISLLKC